MATIQIKLSGDIDKKLQYYMLENDITDKRKSIIKILENQLKK